MVLLIVSPYLPQLPCTPSLSIHIGCLKGWYGKEGEHVLQTASFVVLEVAFPFHAATEGDVSRGHFSPRVFISSHVNSVFRK